MSDTETPATETPAATPEEEQRRRYQCTTQHGVIHEGKRVRAHAFFDAFPWQVKQDLGRGFVEDVEAQEAKRELAAKVQTSANAGTATGHSEGEEGR